MMMIIISIASIHKIILILSPSFGIVLQYFPLMLNSKIDGLVALAEDCIYCVLLIFLTMAVSVDEWVGILG